MILKDKDPHALVLIGVFTVLMLYHILWAARRAYSNGAVALLKRAGRTLLRLFSGGEAGKHDDIVETRMQKRKVDHCMKVGLALWFFVFVIVAIGLHRALSNVGNYDEFTSWQDTCFLGIYGCLSFMQALPQTVTRRTADLYYSALMGTITLVVTPGLCSGRESLLRGIYFANTVRCPLGLMLRPLPLVAFWDFALCTALAISSVVYEPPLLNTRAWYADAIVQAAICLFYMAAAKMLEGCYRAELRAAIDSQAAKEAHAAAQGLLRSFCDAVIEVDSKGCIVGDAEGLSGFLLRGATLRGANLPMMMSNERDQQVVAELLRTCEPGTSVFADAVSIRMRDSIGNVLRMELFWFPFKSFRGDTHCLVGLRESSREASRDAARLRGWSSEPAPRTIGAATAGGEAQASPPEPEAAARAIVAQETEAAQDDFDVFGGEEVAVRIAIRGKGLPIISSSPQFAIHVGRTMNDNLLKYIEDENAFVEWLQEAVNRFVHACVEQEDEGSPQDANAAGPHDTCTVVLQTQSGRRTAACTMTLEAGAEGQMPTASLLFNQFRSGDGSPLTARRTSRSGRERGRGRASPETGASPGNDPGRISPGSSSGSLDSLRNSFRVAL